jgi:hypothetical protein
MRCRVLGIAWIKINLLERLILSLAQGIDVLYGSLTF